jgi:hypothetical protein
MCWKTMPIRCNRSLGAPPRSVDRHLSGRWFDRPIDETNESELAAAGDPHDTEDLTTPYCQRQIGDSGDELEMLKNLQLVEMVLPDGREESGIISVARIARNISGVKVRRRVKK